MKKLSKTTVDNCIPTPSSCTQWTGGDIAFLGICNGDWLDNVVWEIVAKLEELAGEDLSQFDYDGLLDICNQKAPLEVNLLSLLALLRDNQICLKDYIDALNERIAELSSVNNVEVNLKCYADYDNLGNALSITRQSLDQLVIDQLCNHKGRIETIEGKIVQMQAEIAAIDPTATVEELSFPTCLDPATKPTSSQVVTTAQEVCDLKTSVGSPSQISVALSKTPADLNAEFGLIPGWILTPASWAQNYGNLLLEVENLRQRIAFMEDNCCAANCDDVKIGFSAVMNEDQSGIVLRFIHAAGNNIPVGFTDAGSTVSVTDIDGNSLELDIVIANNAEIDIDLTGLNLLGDIDVNVTAKMTNGVILCEKCVYRKVSLPGCSFCTISATAPVTIIYETTIQS